MFSRKAVEKSSAQERAGSGSRMARLFSRSGMGTAQRSDSVTSQTQLSSRPSSATKEVGDTGGGRGSEIVGASSLLRRSVTDYEKRICKPGADGTDALLGTEPDATGGRSLVSAADGPPVDILGSSPGTPLVSSPVFAYTPTTESAMRVGTEHAAVPIADTPAASEVHSPEVVKAAQAVATQHFSIEAALPSPQKRASSIAPGEATYVDEEIGMRAALGDAIRRGVQGLSDAESCLQDAVVRSPGFGASREPSPSA